MFDITLAGAFLEGALCVMEELSCGRLIIRGLLLAALGFFRHEDEGGGG